MKKRVIRVSNFNHEDYRGDQYFVAQNVSEYQAEAIAEALNSLENEHSDDFFRVVPDDYVLPPDWEP